jgi:hypothetical protein
MAKRSVSWNSVTCTAVADTANFTDNGYPTVIQGGSGTQVNNISEIYLGGQSTSSTVAEMLFARDSTVAATAGATTTFDAALNTATASLAAAPLTGNAWTTKPQRSSTLHLLSPSLNTFGGIVRWVAYPGEEINITGNTASLGEVSLSSVSGAGILGGHVIYEPF